MDWVMLLRVRMFIGHRRGTWPGLRGGGGCGELDLGYCAIAVDEDVVGDALDVGLGDGVDFCDFAEHNAPVAEEGLVLGELLGEAFVVGEAAELVGLGAGLEALELGVGDVLGFEAGRVLCGWRRPFRSVVWPGRGTA